MACLKAITLNWEKSIENATPVRKGGGGGVEIPYDGLYGEASPERGTFLRLQVMKG